MGFFIYITHTTDPDLNEYVFVSPYASTEDVMFVLNSDNKFLQFKLLSEKIRREYDIKLTELGVSKKEERLDYYSDKKLVDKLQYATDNNYKIQWIL